MAVSILGTPATGVKKGGTYTAESGSNRLLVYIAASEAAGAGSINTDVTFGGVAMTNIAGADASNAPGQSGSVMHAEVWVLAEADIPAGSQSIAITGTASDSTTGSMYTLSGTSPLVATDTFEVVSTEPTALSGSMNAVTGDAIIAIATDQYTNRTFSWSGLTERSSNSDGGSGDFMYSLADTIAGSDGELTITATNSHTDSTAGTAMVGLVVSEGSAPSPTEATDTVDYVAEAGHVYKDVAGLSGSLAVKDWGYHFDNLANTDQVYYATADESFVTHNADGTSTVTGTGTSVVYGIDATDGVVSKVTIAYQAGTVHVETGTLSVTFDALTTKNILDKYA